MTSNSLRQAATMALARGSRLGRTANAGSATITGTSGPRPWRIASASASPAKAPPPITMLRCVVMPTPPANLLIRYTCGSTIAGRNRAVNPSREALSHVQGTDRPDLDPRPRAARGQPVPRQQPKDQLAARVRRPGDRTGHGGGLPHRRGPAAALAALLFHPARLS